MTKVISMIGPRSSNSSNALQGVSNSPSLDSARRASREAVAASALRLVSRRSAFTLSRPQPANRFTFRPSRLADGLFVGLTLGSALAMLLLAS